jgi:pSer/pThr/pTyr-binding forkhead associated (FHA) protein
VCRTAAPPDDGFCVECGYLFGSPLGPEGEERPLPYLTDAAGRRFWLKLGENIVGREGADIAIIDRTVSRRHARIVVEPDRGDVWLEDMGSTNGTQRAGRVLPPGQRALLADGTSIQFGTVALTLAIPEAPLALPLPAAAPPPDDRVPVAALNAPAANAAPAEEPPVAQLVGANGQVYALTETTTTFGRRPTNHFVLSGDPFVSGAHVQIVFNGSGFHLVDLGSTNGTQLQGARIPPHTPQPLHDGDALVLGRTPLTFRTRLEGGQAPPDKETQP